jgi:surface protein
MSGIKQTILQSNTSLTLSLFFSTSQYHHYPPRHGDDLEQYHGTTTSSTLLSQRGMFAEATSFNQDLSSWDVSAGTEFVSGLGP